MKNILNNILEVKHFKIKLIITNNSNSTILKKKPQIMRQKWCKIIIILVKILKILEKALKMKETLY